MLLRSLVTAGFLSLVVCVPSGAQPLAPWIALEIPTSFTVKYPVVSPTQCYRVARPADGRITAKVTGPGNWEVCIGDSLCPVDCFDSGQRVASTEPLTTGAWYYVKVISKSPGTAATLSIAPTAGVNPAARDVSGDWVAVGDSGDATEAVVTFTQTGSRLSARARFKFRGTPVSWYGEGTLNGNALRTSVTYDRMAPGWTSAVNGRWEMTVSGDGQTMSGRWINNAGQSGAISYRRGGASPPKPGTFNVSGTWVSTADDPNVSNAQVVFTQSGTAIKTRATFYFRGTLVSWNGSGTVSGNRVETTVIYDRLYPGWNSSSNGKWVMTLSPDGETMTGRWYNNAGASGGITYRRKR